MAAIDELKAQRDDINNTIDALTAQKAALQARIDYLNARIASARDRKSTVIQAIRDLGDAWTPEP